MPVDIEGLLHHTYPGRVGIQLQECGQGAGLVRAEIVFQEVEEPFGMPVLQFHEPADFFQNRVQYLGDVRRFSQAEQFCMARAQVGSGAVQGVAYRQKETQAWFGVEKPVQVDSVFSQVQGSAQGFLPEQGVDFILDELVAKMFPVQAPQLVLAVEGM